MEIYMKSIKSKIWETLALAVTIALIIEPILFSKYLKQFFSINLSSLSISKVQIISDY